MGSLEDISSTLLEEEPEPCKGEVILLVIPTVRVFPFYRGKLPK
jgi:hypothetical protein